MEEYENEEYDVDDGDMTQACTYQMTNGDMMVVAATAFKER